VKCCTVNMDAAAFHSYCVYITWSEWMLYLTGFFCGDSQLQYPGFRFTYIPVPTFCCICENKQMIKFYIMTWILSVTSYVSTYAHARTHTHTHTHTFTDVTDTLEAAIYWTVIYWYKNYFVFLSMYCILLAELHWTSFSYSHM
jgi:hypothetical protein